MGAGVFPAGTAGSGTLFVGAGLDPTFIFPPHPVIPYPAALQFDPGARAYVQGANGRMVSADPTDSEVALALGIEFNSLPNANTFGNKLRQLLTRVPAAKQQGIATQEVRRVLKALLDAGRIQLIGVAVTVPSQPPGRTLIGVTYKNLMTGVVPPTVTL